MSTDSAMSRRGFVKLCTSAIALVSASPASLAQPDTAPRRYPRARLVDAHNRPVTAKQLATGESYLFHYPYVSTPCFLINLGRPAAAGAPLSTEDGRAYRWEGGVGPQRSIVAFSAICAHKMSHPARAVSFINYRHQAVTFKDGGQRVTQRPRVIYCCSERSVYDPADGARVLGGPARQPLAAILLEEDRRDGSLHATGAYGGELFERFFREFGFRLAIDLRIADVRAPVSATTTVVPLTEFCQNQVLC